jgi:hypothetical protein
LLTKVKFFSHLTKISNNDSSSIEIQIINSLFLFTLKVCESDHYKLLKGKKNLITVGKSIQVWQLHASSLCPHSHESDFWDKMIYAPVFPLMLTMWLLSLQASLYKFTIAYITKYNTTGERKWERSY